LVKIRLPTAIAVGSLFYFIMKLNGKGVAHGVAVGRVHIYRNNLSIPAEVTICAGEEQSHLDRYLFVKEEALRELEKLKSTMQNAIPKKPKFLQPIRKLSTTL